MAWDVQQGEVEVTEADVESVLDCLRSGWLTMGPRTQELEGRLAGLLGVKHAIVVSSGTAALHLACRAAGLGPGTEAIVPAIALPAVAHAPRYLDAEVVLCDTRQGEAGIDPSAVARLVGPATKVVVVTHMWGYPAAIEELQDLCAERGLSLIEDCSQAIEATLANGDKVGSRGDLGCFSLSPDRQLVVGEGGVVTTDDDDHAAIVRSLRSHAMTSVTWERHRGHGLGYDVTDIGYNYRIDEPRAALGLSRIERLGEEVARRREIVRAYRKGLASADGVTLLYGDEMVERGSHSAFPILLGDRRIRDEVRAAMDLAGVQTTVNPALHRLSEYGARGNDQRLPRAAELADRHLLLPVHPLLDQQRTALVMERLDAGLAAHPS
jgi:dTDP-4-amino-4,6-dideoxygalactose transaminase